MKRYCLALDLKDEASLIAEYEKQHEKVWPELVEGIRSAGIKEMEIYRTGNRLFMVMEVEDSFTFENKAKMDSLNAINEKWETLMWRFQKPLPWAKSGEKWLVMDQIFKLSDQ